jgi:tetratricopeptide (TPR) repeat protein
MTDDDLAVDEREAREALALALALERGQSADDLPEDALGAAALLRSGTAGRLGAERSAALRDELVAGWGQRRARKRPGTIASVLSLALGLGGLLLWTGLPGSLDSDPSGGVASREEAWLNEGDPGAFALAPAAEQAPGGAAPSSALAVGGGEEKREALLAELASDGESQRARGLSGIGTDGAARARSQGDVAHGGSDLNATYGELKRLEALPPVAGQPPAEQRDRQRDAYARLAETALDLGRPEEALQWVRRGLALQGPPSVSAAALRRLEARVLGQLGDRDGAAESYLEALRINEALLDESLDGTEAQDAP